MGAAAGDNPTALHYLPPLGRDSRAGRRRAGAGPSLSAGRQCPRSWSEQRRKAETRQVPRRALNASPLRPVSVPIAEDTWHRGRQHRHRQPPRPPRRSREQGGRDGGGAPAPGRCRHAGPLAPALAQAPQLSCLTRARRARATPRPLCAHMASGGRGATRGCVSAWRPALPATTAVRA